MLTGEVGLTGLDGVPPKPEPPLDPNPEPLLEPKPDPLLDPNPEPLFDPNPEPFVAPKPDPEVPLVPKPLLAPLIFVPAPAEASSALWLGSNTNSHWL